ncbi:splicing factor, Prp19-binding domain-containing protein, partial [Lentinula raphanica]
THLISELIMSAKPKQAPRLARPAARYWTGKAPKNVVEANSDTEEEEEEVQLEEGDVNIAGEQEIVQEGDEDEEDGDLPMKKEVLKTKSMNIALRDVNISKEGKVIVAGREESGKTAVEEDDEDSEDVKPKVEQNEEEDVRFEYESDSEEEEQPKLQFRPVFVAKRNRETITEREKIAQDTEEALKRKELELEERRKQSHDLVAESIKRELAEKEKEEETPDIDDTDGLDPAGEFEAWRLRELARIKKEKEEEVRREQEREEIERRRAMPEEQRLREDLERAQKLREEKPKGQQKFLQKYWHKGAFHQEILKRHDFTEATESTVDVSLLPKVMQVKNFGKRSRTKYTHLLDQDTTIATGGFGGTAPVKAGGKSTETGGCFLCGGPHMKKGGSIFDSDEFVKVAVIGSGLAGLTAAYLLSGSSSSEVEFEVHVFEKSSTLGMDSSSITLPNPGREQKWRIDVPMRSFQTGYYNTLISLYKHLGISFRKTDFSYSFSRLLPKTGDATRRITTDLIYNGNSGLEGVSIPSSMRSSKDTLPTALATAANAYNYGVFALMCIKLLILYIRVLFLSIPVFRPRDVEEMTFRTWSTLTIPKGRVARWTSLDLAWVAFAQDVLLPLFSAVCTAPENSIYDHPVEEFLDYIWLTIGHHHYVALNGVQQVVAKLIAGVQHIHLSSPISSIRIDPDDPTTSSVHISTGGKTQVHTGFHHIIFATQAIRAVPLLESFISSLPPHAKAKRRAAEEQVACLRQFSYCSTLVINHTDPSLLPNDIHDKRDLNLITLDRDSGPDNTQEVNLNGEEDAWSLRCLPSSYTMATHVLTPPEGYPAHLPTIYQTTNPIIEPKRSRILSVAALERAVLTVKSKKAIEGLNVEYGRRWWQSAGQGKSRLGPLQGARGKEGLERTPGIWICGSFAYSGIPLLEGCVMSAKNVVQQGIWASEGVQQQIPW